MAALAHTILRVMKELKLDSLSPKQQRMLQDAMEEYGEAAGSGDDGRKKEADKRLKDAAELCGTKHDTVKNGLKKAGIK
jgi:TRAP-type C4-dicarboxylate transport system substrate-binding protein